MDCVVLGLALGILTCFCGCLVGDILYEIFRDLDD